MSKGTRYDAKFKAAVVKHAERNSVAAAARRFGVTHKSVRRWIGAMTIGDATLTPFKVEVSPSADTPKHVFLTLENRVKKLLAENEKLKTELAGANDSANAMFEFIKHMMQRLEVKE